MEDRKYFNSLTERNKKFVKYIAMGYSQVDAHVKAGFGGKRTTQAKSASDKLKEEKYIRALDEIRDEVLAPDIADAHEVQRTMTQMMRGEIADVKISPVTGEAFEHKPGLDVRFRAANALAKIHGLYVERHELSSDIVINIGGDEDEDEDDFD